MEEYIVDIEKALDFVTVDIGEERDTVYGILEQFVSFLEHHSKTNPNDLPDYSKVFFVIGFRLGIVEEVVSKVCASFIMYLEMKGSGVDI